MGTAVNGNNTITFSTTPTLVNSVLPYATVLSNNWAALSGSNLVAYNGYTTTLPTSGTTSVNNAITDSPSALTGNESINTLKLLTTTSGQSLNINGRTLTLSGNGLLFVGADNYAINGGVLQAGNGVGAYDLIVMYRRCRAI